MTNSIKIFIAGNFAANPFYSEPNWREAVYKKLDEYIDTEITNIDPTKTSVFEDDPMNVFGQDCYLIKTSDIVIVYLTDDVSVGASQEMLIAKYFNKPLIGIAPKEGRFSKAKKELLGKIYDNWKHPFVEATCDTVVNSVEEAAEYIKDYFSGEKRKVIKNISILDNSIDYFLNKKLSESGK